MNKKEERSFQIRKSVLEQVPEEKIMEKFKINKRQLVSQKAFITRCFNNGWNPVANDDTRKHHNSFMPIHNVAIKLEDFDSKMFWEYYADGVDNYFDRLILGQSVRVYDPEEFEPFTGNLSFETPYDCFDYKFKDGVLHTDDANPSYVNCSPDGETAYKMWNENGEIVKEQECIGGFSLTCVTK